VSRQILSDLVAACSALPDEQFVPLATSALEIMQPKVIRFEEQVTTLRERLAKYYRAADEFTQAAKVLSGIPLEGGRVLDKEYKVNIYVQIAQLYLEDEESVQAEMYLNRASVDISGIKDPVLTLRFKSCFARILDYKRKFIEAAAKYLELSQIVADKERMDALGLAVTCAILAKAGPQRSRMLSNLYKDERSSKLEIFPTLEKMYLERVIRKPEVEAFVSQLATHQMAEGGDGLKVHERAIIEHNLLAASKIYTNISFDELGSLLEIAPARAEKIAARMVVEDRLRGTIDQTLRVVHFHGGGDVHHVWDSHIETLCTLTNETVELIAQRFPQFVK